MSALLRRAALRTLLRHPWQLALSVLGVALGVAVVVAIDLANESARRAFALSSEAVTGRATHQIVGGPGGLPEALYRRLRLEAGIRPSAPVVESLAALPGEPGRSLRLLGLDLFAEAPFRPYLGRRGRTAVDLADFLARPGGAVLAAATARELGLAVGDRFEVEIEGRPRALRLAGTLDPGGGLERRSLADLLIVDVATAQELAGMSGRLSRIDLIAPDGAAREPFLAAARALLPAGTELTRSAARTEAAEQMTRAFRLNLQALSLLALLCGAFLIYNTMTFAVVQRRPLLGTLRAVGVTRREIFALVLGEGLALGVAGSALGIGLGMLLARDLVDMVTRTINDLYFALSVGGVSADPWTLAKGAAAGIGVTLMAALAPAWEATSTVPRAVLSRSELEGRAHRAAPRAALAGAALALAGAGLLALPGEGLLPSFAGLFAILIGCALATPAATMALMAALGPPAGALLGQIGRMATRGVVAALSRTGIAVAALMMAVSVTVGVDLMIRSFRHTVAAWLEFSLPADLYLSVFTSPGRRFSPVEGLDPGLPGRLAALPGVARVNTLRHFELTEPSGSLRAVALDIDARSHGAFSFKAGDPEEIWPAFHRGEAVIVSEPLAWRRGLGLGSILRLDSTTGALDLPVAGIFYDYSSERGILMLDRALYERAWADPAVTAISIHAAPDAGPGLADEVRRTVGGDRRVLLSTYGELRRESMRVFDRTFLITGVLRLLAVAVAFFGVLSALMALQLERVRELGVLRACGLTPGQLWSLVTQQTGLMGLAAGLLAIPVGLAMAAIMIFVINRRSFGWTLDMQVSAPALLGAVGLALGAALLAGLYPAWRMARTSPAEALREE